ncbi:ArsC/Spx/MgsR family protein [Pontiella agarivorans]|uniref:ArsC/Spx/MgsR family protein n=1 Tax=Pontiella agarivorans TaxID=3038953 RepID=A0ABU5MYV7_9BACT|nr:ArsC/Spx/MgsR family protein [Pontiella agarivorans]MDZ8119370.1 ArsC/Spx/MgsR family protein [Pontiella agarivorans]
MNKILFYEKTGCKGNARQKALLESNGYSLEVKSLLDEPWERDQLESYFVDRPVEEWFNDKSPAVKQGQVDPSAFDAAGALDLLLCEPILIRRPLIEMDGHRMCGFDDRVQIMLGINKSFQGLEACQNAKERCD